MKQIPLIVHGAIAVAAILAFTPAIMAQEIAAGPAATAPPSEPEFGQRGQWYVYAPILAVDHNRYNNGAMSFSGLSLGTELGTFIRNHFSLGVRLDGHYGWQDQSISTAGDTERYYTWFAGVHVVAGWQRPLSSWVSFWPKLSVGGSFGQSDQSVFDAESGAPSKERINNYGIDANVRLPLVLHLSRHLFAEVAYQIGTSITHNTQYDSVQVSGNTSVGLGGWF